MMKMMKWCDINVNWMMMVVQDKEEFHLVKKMEQDTFFMCISKIKPYAYEKND